MTVYGPSNVSLEVPTDECTGISASWCPIHGDCECTPDDEEGNFFNGKNDPHCPLHCTASTHATTLHGGVLDTPKVFTIGTVKDRAGREWAGWACGLDYGVGPDQIVLMVMARGREEKDWFLVTTEQHNPIPAKEANDRLHVLVAGQMRRYQEDDTSPVPESRPSRAMLVDDEPTPTAIPAGTRIARPQTSEELARAAFGGPAATKPSPSPGLPQPYAHLPGSLDAFPVGQAPGEAAAFSHAVAGMAAPRVLRDPKPVEPDPGAALATMDRSKLDQARKAIDSFLRAEQTRGTT